MDRQKSSFTASVGCAALLVDAILPDEPMRQRVLNIPFPPRFLIASPPGIMVRRRGVELAQLTHTIAKRMTRCLERHGLLVRDADNSHLTTDVVDSANAGRVQGSEMLRFTARR